MKKFNKLKKLGLIVLLVLICAVIFTGCASSKNPYDNKPDDGFVMKSLNVSIDATKGDRSMIITEEYIYNFNVTSHGYYRDFAINSGEKIRDIKVSGLEALDGSYKINNYEVEHIGGDILRVTVRNSDREVPLYKDLKSTITYTIITPKVKTNPDVLMINAIGQGYSCKILNSTITVKLPAPVVSEPQYFIGEWGQNTKMYSDMIVQTVSKDEKEYKLTLMSELPAFSGVTVYYPMAEGTFKNYRDNQMYITLIFTIMIIVLAVVLKIVLGRNPQITPITNFYPPKRKGNTLNPVELGFLIDNKCSGEDVTSLLFYWAAHGYIKIQQDGENENFDSDKTRLLKVKDLEIGVPNYEKEFFKKIFIDGNEVLLSSLTNKTYQEVLTVQSSIKNKYKGKLFSNGVKAVSVGLCALVCIFAFFNVLLAYQRVNYGYINLFGFIALIPIAISNWYGVHLVNNWQKIDKGKLLKVILFFVITTISSLLMFVFISYDVMSLLEISLLILGVVVTSMIAPFIVKRTSFYTQELNDIVGFRNFLIAAEKDKLEMMLKDNPQYYYDILPYANVLGVSDIWQDKFKNLTLQPPVYYNGGGNVMFNIVLFNSFYRNTYFAASKVVISSPSGSSRSGGGFGGGGFGGGGFGGGGGGRC